MKNLFRKCYSKLMLLSFRVVVVSILGGADLREDVALIDAGEESILLEIVTKTPALCNVGKLLVFVLVVFFGGQALELVLVDELHSVLVVSRHEICLFIFVVLVH